jgi:16S rRNA (cytosine967-C5)-methyltransferase
MARGHCQVQDEAAGAVVAFMDPQAGDLILDACAAPGGKATFIAQRMRGEVTVCAL